LFNDIVVSYKSVIWFVKMLVYGYPSFTRCSVAS